MVGWVMYLALVSSQLEAMDIRLARSFTAAVREANRNADNYDLQVAAAQASFVAYHMVKPAERFNIARSMLSVGSRAQSLRPAAAEGHVWAVIGAGYLSFLNGSFATAVGNARYREAARAAFALAEDNRRLQALLITHEAELLSHPEAGRYFNLVHAYTELKKAEDRYAQSPLTIYLHADLALRQSFDGDASMALRRFSRLAPLLPWERQLLLVLVPGVRMLEATIELPFKVQAKR